MRQVETVIARDGTPIAYERRGHGPPLLMVHGSGVDHSRWGGIVTELGEHFTLFMVDRRGRGKSGDGAVYAIEREFEDIAAVLEATPAPARVLGHSFGAICALEAARLTNRIARMVLYEPPFRVPGQPTSFSSDLPQRLQALLAGGDRDGVATAFLAEVLRMRGDEIRRLRSTSSWSVRLDAAATLPREIASAASYVFRPEAFASLRLPVLFVTGSRSPVALQASTRMAAAAVAGGRLEILAGHGHGAMATGPNDFLEKIMPFLLS